MSLDKYKLPGYLGELLINYINQNPNCRIRDCLDYAEAHQHTRKDASETLHQLVKNNRVGYTPASYHPLDL